MHRYYVSPVTYNKCTRLDLPSIFSGDVDEQVLLDWLGNAHTVLSIGEPMFNRIADYIESLDDQQSKPKHEIYLPACPLDLLDITRKSREEPIRGPQHIMVFTGERKDLDVKGLDYDLAVGAASTATTRIFLNAGQHVNMNFWTMATTQDEREKWEDHFKTIVDRESKADKRLAFVYKTMQEQNELKTSLKRASLCVLPLMSQSNLFGVESMMAAYAGVPVVVSSNSGFANLLRQIPVTNSILDVKGVPADLAVWEDKIFQKIMNVKESEEEAIAIKKNLLLDISIEESHNKFITAITGINVSRLYFSILYKNNKTKQCMTQIS